MERGGLLTKFKTKFLNNEQARGVFKNYAALISLQAINNILPFATIPYLTTVIGMDNYGLTVFAQTIVLYFQLFVDYGFDYTGTQLIAVNRNNKQKLAHALTTIISLKFLLSIAALIVFVLMVWAVPAFRANSLVYIFSYGILLGNILFPSWFFQGMEQMKYITYINVTIKILATLSIFIFVKNAGDYVYVPLIYAVGYLLAAIAGLIFAFRKFQLKWVRVSFKDFKTELVGGYHIFISTLGISVYRMANPIILGLLFTTTVVGYYSIAERVIKALQMVTNPLSQALFPFLSNKMSSIVTKDKIKVLNKVALYYAGPLVVVTAAVFLFSSPITVLLLKVKDTPSALHLKIMSFVILFGCLNFLYGIIGLINLGEKKFFSIAVGIAGLFSVIVTVIGSKYGNSYWASVSMSLTEVLLFIIIFSRIWALKLRAA